MRALKNSLFFLLGVLLVGVPMFAFAETTAATPQQRTGWVINNKPSTDPAFTGATMAEACQKAGALFGYSFQSASGSCGYGVCCIGTKSGSTTLYAYSNVQQYNYTAYTCPNSSWTLIGQTCSRPDCDPGQTRDPVTGSCEAPKCQLSANAQIGSTRYQLPWPQPNGVTWCIQNCVAYPVPPFNVQGNSAYAYFAVNGAGGAASTCTGSTTTPDTVPNPTTTADPPCNLGDGALAVGQGVKCVPSTTPGATVPPKTSSQQNKQTFPDGSTSTTTITQTCTGEGACSSTTTTNITNSTAGGAGQAGTPGTTTGKSDKPAVDQPGFCAQNPNLQICKGNMAEEGTQKQVLDAAKKTLEELEKITKPTITDDSSLTEKGQFKESEELKNADKDATDRATGSIDPVSAPKSAWESAMSSGFWGPIPQSGCSPHSSKIGPFQWTFDPCPIASKISDIGAYAMWVILAISTFVMVTGGRKA